MRIWVLKKDARDILLFLSRGTSGELFDKFAKEVKERIKLDIRVVGR